MIVLTISYYMVGITIKIILLLWELSQLLIVEDSKDSCHAQATGCGNSPPDTKVTSKDICEEIELLGRYYLIYLDL